MSPLNLRRFLRRSDEPPYDPKRYWESRARELVEVYDHPETWEEREWMRGGVEESVVPEILQRERARTVLVAGAGSGRQYEFLSAAGLDVQGFDISPSLVAVCRVRYPEVPTHVGDVVDARAHAKPADAVLTSAVLQHVRPENIETAADALKSLAHHVIVVRELTAGAEDSQYQFPHDYDSLFSEWRQIHREVTDERGSVRVELIAWRRPD